MEPAERIETIRDDFRELSQEVVLCLAGVFAVHQIDDDVVWEVARSLDRVFDRYRRRIEGTAPDGKPDTEARKHRPHPAMAYLLHRLSQRRGA